MSVSDIKTDLQFICDQMQNYNYSEKKKKKKRKKEAKLQLLWNHVYTLFLIWF
jgi:ribonuclease HI